MHLNDITSNLQELYDENPTITPSNNLLPLPHFTIVQLRPLTITVTTIPKRYIKPY